MKSKFARLRLAALVSSVCMFHPAFADAGLYRMIKVSWTPPTENIDGSPLTDLLGYYIYFGASPNTMVQQFFAPVGSLSVDFPYPPVDTYYFGMTAVNNSGVESSIVGPISTGGQ
jgi:hypothetical protein